MRLRLERRASPIGTMLLATDDDGTLRALDFVEYEARLGRLLRLQYGSCALEDGAAPASVTRALDGYFAGELGMLADVPVMTGGTAFQREVWAALRSIQAGTTTSYGNLAARLGRPQASRAVGFANGSNPVAIVIPCHRLIGADGALTGYGGGLPRKKWLLEHEGVKP
jgi:methylated-DNA-[protein]-cysteine S-methyltransferase